jgi:hypothetical protein
MFMTKRRKLEREALVRIAGTPTVSSSEEAKTMAKVATLALSGIDLKKIWDDPT